MFQGFAHADNETLKVQQFSWVLAFAFVAENFVVDFIQRKYANHIVCIPKSLF